MKLVVFGLNHRTAPVEVRESWALSPDESREALGHLRKSVSPSEHVIVSTCNRTEFYSHVPFAFSPEERGEGVLDAAEAVRQYSRFYRRFSHEALGLEPQRAARLAASLEDPSHFYVHVADDALEHLFRVAGGLDSMILGESQILRQLKECYALAQESQAAGKFFQKLFPAALRAGKRVRSLTPISIGAITPGQAALRLADESLGGLAGRSLLVIGSGKIAASAALALKEEKLADYRVINRTPGRARELVERIGAGTPIAWERLEEMLATSDVVVSSTGAVVPIVSSQTLARVQAARGHRPLVIVDLAIPRDFDPACAAVPGVRLFNIDDLNRIIEQNVAQRHKHIPHAEAIVQREMQVFQRWITYRKVDPVLRHMVERFEQIGLGELQTYISRFPPEFHPLLRELTSSLVKKLLHFPIEKLKSLRDLKGLNDTEVSFLKRLFLTDLE